MEPAADFQRLMYMNDAHSQPQGTNQPDGLPAGAKPTDILSSPANLIASLPGALGFFPNEAVVLINLRTGPAAPGELHVGPYQCVDLGSPSRLHEEFCRIPMHQRATTFAVVVSRVPDSGMVALAAEMLSRVGDEFGPIIEACWIVSEVAEGTPYRLLFGPEEDFDEWGWADAIQAGAVSSVVASPAMRPLLDHGVLPELDRADIFEHFDPVSLADTNVCEQVAAAAHHRGIELVELTVVAPSLARADIERGCDLFLAAPALSMVDTECSLLIDDIFDNPEDIELLAALLSRNRLRDSLILDAMTSPRRAGALLLTMARNFTGVIRANALCLWAMVAVTQGLLPWAAVALQRAEEEVEHHQLSMLLSQAMQMGKLEELVHAATEGCRDTWREMGD